MRRTWSKSEIDYLVKHFPDDTGPEIATAICRPVTSVYRKAHSLGIVKSKEFMKSHKRRVFTGEEGRAFRFEKDHIPWNKDKNGIITGGVTTQFKPGNIPHNNQHDGAITIRTESDGKQYKWIRISRKNWLMLHVKVWTDKYGPVPEGKIVVFKNRDRMDVRLDNLELITRAENMRRNTINRYPEDLKKSMRMLGKLKRVINEKNNP